MSKKRVKTEVRKAISGMGNVLVVCFSTLCMLLCLSLVWMFRTWPYLTMQELMFQIQSPIQGTSRAMIENYIIFCIPLTLIVCIADVVGMVRLRKRKKLYRVLVSVILVFSAAILGITLYKAWNKLDIGGYAENNSTYSDFIDLSYKDPDQTALTFPQQKRNLIYIYLESMETTYADQQHGGGFEENYIPELTELAMENEDFSGSDSMLNGGASLNYTTWTMGALFAQTSGLPLVIPIDGNAMNTQETFLPKVTSLGDILEEEGYEQVFMIGSDGEFGGRRLYFTDHGDYEIQDYDYFRDLGKFPGDYRVWWGFEDEKLFSYAKEELLKLASQSQPFNFTMLTADTHFEDGYECRLCGTEYGENTYANVISCSSRQVSEFVEWIQDQDFYENTTIVISGDHRTMDSDFCADISEKYGRKVYTAYINSAVQAEDPDWRREYTTFDAFPTTLASLGVEIDGERLGLGTNLFSDKMTLSELYGTDREDSELEKKSKFMEELTSDIRTDLE